MFFVQVAVDFTAIKRLVITSQFPKCFYRNCCKSVNTLCGVCQGILISLVVIFYFSEVTSAEKKKIKMVVSKHLTHFCYPIRLVLHQHLNSHVAYPGIPPENSNHTRGQSQHLPSYPLLLLEKRV